MSVAKGLTVAPMVTPSFRSRAGSERSEESGAVGSEILRCAQDDRCCVQDDRAGEKGLAWGKERFFATLRMTGAGLRMTGGPSCCALANPGTWAV